MLPNCFVSNKMLRPFLRQFCARTCDLLPNYICKIAESPVLPCPPTCDLLPYYLVANKMLRQFLRQFCTPTFDLLPKCADCAMLCWLGLSFPLYKSSVAQPKTSVSIGKSSSQQQNSRGEVVQSWEINIYFLSEILFEIRVYFVGFLDFKAFHILGVFWE